MQKALTSFLLFGCMRFHLLLSGSGSKSTALSLFLLFQLASYNAVSYLHRCVFNLCLSGVNICEEEGSLKAGN